MEKKLFFLCFFLLTIVFPVSGTRTISTIWKSENLSLTMIGNYGSPLGESLRQEFHREKSYHFYNLLKNNEIEGHFKVDARQYVQEEEGIFNLNSLKLLNTNEVDPHLRESFNPVYESGRLVYQSWSENYVEIFANNNIIYRSSEPLKLVGKRENNILILENEVLKYLDEIEWMPVEELKGYTVGLIRWVDTDHIAFFAEHNRTGKKVAGVTSVRRPRSTFHEIPGGIFVDIAVSNNLQHFYLLIREADKYRIFYKNAEQSWENIGEFKGKIYLLGLREENLFLFNSRTGSIQILDGPIIENITLKILKSFPRGKYLHGEGLNFNGASNVDYRQTQGKNTAVLFYNPDVQEKLAGYGLDKMEKFGSSPQIWLIPETYRNFFKELPGDEKLGNLYFSVSNQTIYYDMPGKNYLRDINMIQLKRDYKWIKFCGILLLLVIVGGIFIANRKKIIGVK